MWIYLLSTLVYFCTGSPVPGLDFDHRFNKYYQEYGYKGGQVGVIVDAKLAFAKGYGKTHEHEDVYAHTVVPISAISKGLTSVAILKMAENGDISLDNKVFGPNKTLGSIKPFKNISPDPKIYDITIDHLLRHTAGWNSTKSKLYDPLLNTALLQNGYKIHNITADMHLSQLMTPEDVISYMMSQPLDFTPGTQSVISNLGYLILGRIIEEVSGDSYRDYVKKHVLIPCGMMHTKIGRPRLHTKKRDANEPIFNDAVDISPNFVDSALGWESNAYDMMRFAQCLDGGADFKILSDNSLRILQARPRDVPAQRSNSWMGAGFYVNNHGAVWIEGEFYTDDLLFFHKGPLIKTPSDTLSNQGKPTSWVVLLTGQMYSPVKGILNSIANGEKHWSSENHFLNDLADARTVHGATQQLVKYQIEEHHMEAYARALAQLRYDVTWINGFSFKKKTYFVVISHKVSHPIYNKVVISTGLTEKTLYRHKLALDAQGYNITFLQNYKSHSHKDSSDFVAIFRKNYYQNKTLIRYGDQHYTQSYRKLLELYAEEGYHPTSQSLMYDGVDGLVTFILEENPDRKSPVDFKFYSDITRSRLDKTVNMNARYKRKLIYLDEADYFGRPIFSAIFEQDQLKTMLFNSGLRLDDMDKIIKREQVNGLLPRIICGYTEKGQLRYSVYLEK